MPDFERLAQFKRLAQTAEAMWCASELEKAWTYGCPAIVSSESKPPPLKRGTGKITGTDRKEYMRELMRKRRAAQKAAG